MDEVRAARMTTELIGKTVNGWFVKSYLGAGKSALVLGATKDGVDAALKIFDPELVERFGKDVQSKRIERELTLKGKSHPNLVTILDGGYCDDEKVFFVAMEHLIGTPLSNVLTHLPRELLPQVISKVAAAAKFLEELNLPHRDIKPDNILVSDDYENVWLMDLGVIRPIGEGGLTDGDQRPFIGTLRYSSPEFLYRTEVDTLEGWRALTFYQLGAVLHDLIMRRRIFADHVDPFAALVDAVRNEIPLVKSDDVSMELIQLCQCCLSKDPGLRLRLVKWQDFHTAPGAYSDSSSTATENRIRLRKQLASSQLSNDPRLSGRTSQLMRKTVDFVGERIQALVRKEYVGNELFPPAQFFERAGSDPGEAHFSILFEASTDHALPCCLQLWLTIQMLDVASVAINLMAVASLNQTPLESHAYEQTRAVPIFQGIWNESLVSKRLRDFLYSSLDQAQSAKIDDMTIPVIRWLPNSMEAAK